MFLFSKRLRASRNSFLFSPAKFKLYIMSLTETSEFPKFSCRLWRCLTIDRSSFPQRQVVFRIKTTMVLTSVCSLVCRLDKSPMPPRYELGFIVLKVFPYGTNHNLCSCTMGLFSQAACRGTTREPPDNNPSARQPPHIPAFDKAPLPQHFLA
jgi:hypothetical protein